MALQELVGGERRVAPPVSRPGVQLRLMRGFELTCDGSRVQLPRNAQRLVAFLALNERPMLRGYIAGTLWLDSSETHSGGCLRTALWRLRQLGHQLVEADRQGLSVANDVAVDVRRLAAIARGMSHGDTVPDGDELYDVTAGGELLPGWYDDWVVMERERMRELWLQTLETAAERLTKAGRHDAAVVVALAAVEAEPLRESATRVLIKAHLARGNRAQALRHYALFAEALERDLRIEPSPEMQMLTAECWAPQSRRRE